MATDRNLHISSAFPYEKQSVEALGNRMAYVDVGSSSSGPVAVFLHGNPNSSYLWRNIFSHVSKDNRCVVPDLIGFGDSDKVTGLEYRIRDHQRYIDAFLDAVLPTGRITFVIHDWSSALGLDWASRHHERVAGLALMEWITALSSWASRDLVFQDHFRTFRTQDVGRALIIEQNFFVDTILTMGVVRGLTEEEMIHYRRPFLKQIHPLASRMEPTETVLLGDAGTFVTEEDFVRLRGAMKNVKTVFLGLERHFVQEDYPHTIGKEIVDWVEESSL